MRHRHSKSIDSERVPVRCGVCDSFGKFGFWFTYSFTNIYFRHLIYIFYYLTVLT